VHRAGTRFVDGQTPAPGHGGASSSNEGRGIHSRCSGSSQVGMMIVFRGAISPIENYRLPIPIGNVETAGARATTVNEPASDRESIPSALVRGRRRGSLLAHGQPLHLRTICRSPGHRRIRAIIAGPPCSTWPEGRHWQLSRARSSSYGVSPGAQDLRQPLFPMIRAAYRADRRKDILTAKGAGRTPTYQQPGPRTWPRRLRRARP
jgi:hypothetical protein